MLRLMSDAACLMDQTDHRRGGARRVGKRRRKTLSRSHRSPAINPVELAAIDDQLPTIDVLRLSGAELLRLILNNSEVWERLARCSRCGFQATLDRFADDGSSPCPECRGACTRLAIDWWTRASRRMRLACQRDPKLLRAVKAEWHARHCGGKDQVPPPLPPLPGFLSWLSAASRRYERRGRPLDSSGHYKLAHGVDRLQRAGLSIGQIHELLSQAGSQSRLRIYDTFPEDVRSFLGGEFRERIAHLPFV